MCEPVHYTVSYEINPWMDKTRFTDADLAVRQWRTLRDVYLELGHTVETIDPVPGLPDMVYAANGATVVDGVVYSARFRHPERQPEGPAYQKWFADRGYVTHTAAQTNEGEGDLLLVGDLVLAGTGFRTERAAHAELQELFGRPVVSLDLVSPHYYHLDTALAVLSSDPAEPQIAYYPPAFSAGLAGGAAPAVPRRGAGHRAGRGRPRPQRRVRRPERRRRARRGRTWPTPCASAATSRSPWTPASCSRAAAAPSAARWRSGPPPGPGDDHDGRGAPRPVLAPNYHPLPVTLVEGLGRG